jgi:hypothetical protein
VKYIYVRLIENVRLLTVRICVFACWNRFLFFLVVDIFGSGSV